MRFACDVIGTHQIAYTVEEGRVVADCSRCGVRVAAQCAADGVLDEETSKEQAATMMNEIVCMAEVRIGD